MSIRYFLIKFIISFLVSSTAINYLTNFISLDKNPTPWIFITLILIPSGYAITALFKVSEVDEHPSLSRSELRRLRPIVSIKKRALFILVAYYMLSATCIAIGLFSLSISSEIYSIFLSICGGLVCSSMYSFFYVASIMDEIQRFKSMLIHRSEEEKKTKELLDTLNKKAD